MSKTCNDCSELARYWRGIFRAARCIYLCNRTGHRVSPSMSACALFVGKEKEDNDGQEYKGVAETVVPTVAGV